MRNPDSLTSVPSTPGPRPPRLAPAPAVETSYMNATEAAAYLRVSISWLRKATRRTEVPSFQIGTRVLYDRPDLDAYIAERKKEAAWGRLRG